MSECTKASHPYCCGGTFTNEDTQNLPRRVADAIEGMIVGSVEDEIGACYR